VTHPELSPAVGVDREPTVLKEPPVAASLRAELFGAGTRRELRKAIVHREVLGKPLALKEDL
jgi:hypothetical protein